MNNTRNIESSFKYVHSISNQPQTVRLFAKYWNVECIWMRGNRVSLLCCRIHCRICYDSIFDGQTRPRNRLYSGRRCIMIPIKQR